MKVVETVCWDLADIPEKLNQKTIEEKKQEDRGRVPRDIRFQANISKIKRIFVRFEVNKTGFIRLFRIKAN
jgi:hypothetical protein